MSALSSDRASVIGSFARPRDALRAGPLLPAAVARMIAFAALATFGAAHWARFVDPAATLALLGCVAVPSAPASWRCASTADPCERAWAASP